MKKTKKNNKGFSLVELIVVVLIMAIIAVALAPQVMKWIGTSRTNTDIATMDTLVSNAQTALTNEKAWAEASASGTTFVIKLSSSGVSIKKGSSDYTSGDFYNAFVEACGGDLSKIKAKESTNANLNFTISDGKISAKAFEPTPEP